jgi:hypothetical protein
MTECPPTQLHTGQRLSSITIRVDGDQSMSLGLTGASTALADASLSIRPVAKRVRTHPDFAGWISTGCRKHQSATTGTFAFSDSGRKPRDRSVNSFNSNKRGAAARFAL